MESRFWVMLFCLLLGLGFTGRGLFLGYKSWKSSSWPETEAYVSRVEKSHYYDSEDNDYTYYLKMLYSYEIDGEIYANSDVTFSGDFSTGSLGERDSLYQLFNRDSVTIIYNPENPGESVIIRGWDYSFLGAGIFVLAVALLLLRDPNKPRYREKRSPVNRAYISQEI